MVDSQWLGIISEKLPDMLDRKMNQAVEKVWKSQRMDKFSCNEQERRVKSSSHGEAMARSVSV